MGQKRAFRVAAVCWVAYALVTALPVVGFPMFLAQTVIRALIGLAIAARFWFRPGRGIAIIGTLLGLAFIPLTIQTLANLSTLSPFYLVVSVVGLFVLVSSANAWRTTRST
jgi:hypothetical protein